jgi:C1A family cysteine protease
MSEGELVRLQQAIEDQGHAWRAGPTPLSALPLEVQQRHLGLRLEREEMARLAELVAQPALRAAEYPPAWDWRDVQGIDWTTPVRDQRACGSCVAFGTVGVMEIMLKRRQGDPSLNPDLSEAHLFFCGCGQCCDRGWWPTYALNYAQTSGVPDEGCFPYADRNQPCSTTCDDWQDRAVRVLAWQEVADVGARKEWLASRGPMVGCMAVYRDFYSYTSGVYRHTTGELAGYHAVAVVGYVETEGAWICKNSWGTGWGEGGWFKLGYGECGIDTEFAMYGVEAVSPPAPVPEPGPDPDPSPGPQPSGCDPLMRLVAALRGP